MSMEHRYEELSGVLAAAAESTDSGSDLFSDDEYGLLNIAKFAVHEFHVNGSEDVNASAPNIVTAYPSSYSQFQIIFLALIMTAMMVLIVVGNMLVVIAIATENNLTSIQNWFIASLAVADMLIGLVVMPFSLSYELMGYWMFGTLWCEIHAAMDVFMCTASIMNICLISLDRYWSITRAIDYLNARTPNKVALMIVTVWLLSGLICIPPLLGWKADEDLDWFFEVLDEQGNRTQLEFLQYLDHSGKMDLNNFTDTLERVVYPQCGLSQDLGYVMYSAFGSFYIPSCIMVFVYIKIYYAARERARRNIKIKKKSRRKSNRPKPANIRLPPPSIPLPGSSGSSMANTPVVGNGSARVSVPTISGGHLENATAETCTPRPTTDNNNVPAGNQSKSLATSFSSPMVLQSALKRNGSKPEKRTRFSFGSTENHRPSDSGSEQSVNKLNDEEHQLLQDAQRPGDEVSYHENGGKKYPPHPKGKKMVHILSAVSVSLNDAPLSLCDTPTPCDTPTSTGIPSPGPGHAYGACIGNGMRSRRSIGVSTRPDDNSDNENSEAGDRSSNSDSGKIRCLRLRSRFRAPPHGRRPSKETREMIDTGKLRKIHKAASVSSSSSFGGTGNNKGQNVAKLSLDKPPKKSILSKSPTPNSKASPISGNGMSVSISGPGGTTVAMMPATLPQRPTESEAEKEKKRVARKKERRATLILGLIMGSFIACWLPFFFLYSISPVCPICEEAPDSPCCVQGWGFSFAFWLGYSNSALNPVIYTIFNKDFRRAFKRILFK